MSTSADRIRDRAGGEASERDLLRFLTCGSVDDGKSTLIGRLLLETGSILADQMSGLESDSRRYGTTGDDPDLALLVDGLHAEREQGITIDVAYRFFATPRRSFIAIDAPGHEQYTRNMATGASNAQLAVVLVDARKGILPQTKRHSVILSLLGVRDVILAVNKIDLIGYDEARFRQIASDYASYSAQLGFASVTPVPISARHGDNVGRLSPATPWFRGAPLIELLETVQVHDASGLAAFRFPVQLVHRPRDGFRGLAGSVVGGTVRVGDEVVLARSGRIGRVERIGSFDGEREDASAGDAVVIVLDREIDAGRGEVLADPKNRPDVSSRFAAKLVWMAEEPLLKGSSFLLRIGTATVPATLTRLAHRVDIESAAAVPASRLLLNDIGEVEVEAASPVAFDAYEQSRATGSFILIDRVSNATVAAGMVVAPASHSHVHSSSFDVDRKARAELKGQRPLVLWFTGLPGAGKSTIANLVEQKLHRRGRHTAVLDGDNLRQGLNSDLAFDEASRTENIRRAAEVARLMTDAGLIVLCAFVSPFQKDRDRVRAYFVEGEFVEIFVNTPLAVCAQRDPKGHYARARSGGMPGFTGIGHSYERPEKPELVLDGAASDPAALADQVVAFIDAFIRL